MTSLLSDEEYQKFSIKMMCMFVSNSFHMNFKLLGYIPMDLCCCDTRLMDN